jgi:hypothetical protein
MQEQAIFPGALVGGGNKRLPPLRKEVEFSGARGVVAAPAYRINAAKNRDIPAGDKDTTVGC